jgi:methyl-accepting chemotaxis protein
VNRLCEAVALVSKGDLSQMLETGSDDEIGALTNSLNDMVKSLNQMVRQVNTATDELAIISENLSDASGKVVTAARIQAEGAINTSSAVLKINASIKGVAQSVESLSLSASESSSSIMEMAASVEEVALNTDNLSQSVGNVSSSIMEMTSSIKHVGGGVNSLVEAINSTSSSVVQMDVSLKQVEKNVADASSISEEMRKDAELGKAAVEASISGINDIKKSSDITFEVIYSLSQRAKDIGVILSVIDEVAEQTNLLALNAAIIAAQAGERGRGFAVVAGEIKALSDRTRSSTREIAQVIKGVQDETARAEKAIRTADTSISDGKKLSEESGAVLQKIYDGVQKATDQMREIARATLEQSKGGQNIKNATEQISDMVNQIANATKEQAVGSDQIISATEKMKELTIQVRNAAREQSDVGNFIASSTENITNLITRIRQACEEQSMGSDQISCSVEDIHSSAEINLEATKMMNESVNNIFAQISVLKKGMSSFKV